MDLAGRKERGKAYCPIVVGSGIVPLPEKKTVKTIKTVVLECTKRLQDFTRLHTINCVLKPAQIQVLFPAPKPLRSEWFQGFFLFPENA